MSVPKQGEIESILHHGTDYKNLDITLGLTAVHAQFIFYSQHVDNAYKEVFPQCSHFHTLKTYSNLFFTAFISHLCPSWV